MSEAEMRQKIMSAVKISAFVHVAALAYQFATDEVFFRETPLLFAWDVLWGFVTFTVFIFVVLSVVAYGLEWAASQPWKRGGTDE